MPTDDASAAVGRRRRGAGAEVAGQQRHRVADGHHLAEQGLSQGGRRDRLGGQRRAAQRHRPRAVHRDRRRRSPRCPRAARRWTASRRRAARCPPGCRGPATPATAAVVRDPVSDTASHSRMPRAAMAFGCSRTTPRRESTAEVFSRAVSVSCGPRRAVMATRPARACASPQPRHRSAGGGLAPGGSRAARRAVARVSRPTPRDARPASAGCGRRTGCGRGRPTMITKIRM